MPPSQGQTLATQSGMGHGLVADQPANGARFRTLANIDVFSKEALAIEVGSTWAENMWPPHRSASQQNARRRHTCSLTMAASSPAACWIYGPIIIRHESISVGQENQPTTRMSKALMNRSGMSA